MLFRWVHVVRIRRASQGYRISYGIDSCSCEGREEDIYLHLTRLKGNVKLFSQ